MKKLTVFFGLMILGVSGLLAQDEANLIRTLFKQEKRALAEEFLQLNSSEAEKFWPVYDAYEAARVQLADSQFRTLSDYAEKFATLTDDQADSLLKSALDIQKKYIDLEKKYYSKAAKAVGGRKASSWIQMEEYIRTSIRMEIMESIPFVGEE